MYTFRVLSNSLFQVNKMQNNNSFCITDMSNAKIRGKRIRSGLHCSSKYMKKSSVLFKDDLTSCCRKLVTESHNHHDIAEE